MGVSWPTAISVWTFPQNLRFRSPVLPRIAQVLDDLRHDGTCCPAASRSPGPTRAQRWRHFQSQYSSVQSPHGEPASILAREVEGMRRLRNGFSSLRSCYAGAYAERAPVPGMGERVRHGHTCDDAQRSRWESGTLPHHAAGRWRSATRNGRPLPAIGITDSDGRHGAPRHYGATSRTVTATVFG